MPRVLLVAAFALMLTPAALAKRAPTYLERATAVSAFNVPGYAFATKCIAVQISTANPRFAEVGPSPTACRKPGTAPDSYAILVRSSPEALHWRAVFRGNGTPACSAVPENVLVDLLGESECAR
jgi:hypothetical protein